MNNPKTELRMIIARYLIAEAVAKKDYDAIINLFKTQK
jgi:hypothetical protein